MSEFKVGDRVRVRSNYMDLRVGDVGTVTETCGEGAVQCCQVETDDGHTSYPLSTRLEKVEPEPQFEVGDRVRCIKRQWDTVPVGATGTVIPCPNHPRVLNVIFDGIEGDSGTYTSGWAMGPEDVEKVGPPVETFGPGDFVRSKAVPDYTYLVLRDGYVDLYNSIYNSHKTSEFNSLHYERVTLVDYERTTLVEPPL